MSSFLATLRLVVEDDQEFLLDRKLIVNTTALEIAAANHFKRIRVGEP